MIEGIDHVLIAVDDVSDASDRLVEFGFEVVAGGQHPQFGTHNALVPLADGTYIELIGVEDAELAAQHPHTRQVVEALEGPNRLALMAIESSAIGADVAAARERGLDISDPVEGERIRPDGTSVRWRTAHPEDPKLPFLIADMTPRENRVGPPSQGLGADLAILAVELGGDPRGDFGRGLEALLGVPPVGVEFPTGRGTLRLDPDTQSGRLARVVYRTEQLTAIEDAARSSQITAESATGGAFGTRQGVQIPDLLGAEWLFVPTL